MDAPITPDLARAARALTQVSAHHVSVTADVPLAALLAYEKGAGPLSPEHLHALKVALEHYGAVFVPADTKHGHGVRQKFNASKVAKLENWENEGGPTGEDDI